MSRRRVQKFQHTDNQKKLFIIRLWQIFLSFIRLKFHKLSHQCLQIFFVAEKKKKIIKLKESTEEWNFSERAHQSYHSCLKKYVFERDRISVGLDIIITKIILLNQFSYLVKRVTYGNVTERTHLITGGEKHF